MTALKNDYVDDATKPGMNPSETEVQEFYDAHDWTVDGVEGKAPLADVKANVKTALRTERYRERVQSKADKIDVSTLPWKRLYAYAATWSADRRAEADPSVGRGQLLVVLLRRGDHQLDAVELIGL